MHFGWAVVAAALGYIGILFAVASWGDSNATKLARFRPLIYAFSLGVYCTSWTFYGSVGLATTRGFDFLAIYVGPALLYGLGYAFIGKIVRLAKTQNITSLADFIAARYGKNQGVAATVTLIAVFGALPYVSLQLKAVSSSIAAVLGGEGTIAYVTAPIVGDLALLVSLALALFSILFGTRHIDATEHQHGLVFAVAVESLVKLAAFLIVGCYVVYGMFDGPADLWSKAAHVPGALDPVTRELDGGQWFTMIWLSFVAALLLPRMFHLAVVENHSERDIRGAAFAFPTYLVAINLFVLPIAIAGLVVFRPGSVDADTLVLALPLNGGSELVSLIAFIGGLSSATAMVIVATVALSIMIANEIVMPVLLHGRGSEVTESADMGWIVLVVRRLSILAVLMLAYAYYKLAATAQQLASIGLLSFAAISQLAPAFFGGLMWRRATARGAIAGMIAGFAVWTYTMLLPSFSASGLIPAEFLTNGPFGIAALRPQVLLNLNFEPLTHGVFWSLAVNILFYVGVSLLKPPEAIEQLQANVFIEVARRPGGSGSKLWRTSVTVGDLQETVSRYLGVERTAAAFHGVARARGLDQFSVHAEADIGLLRQSEHLLASAIGAASSRLVLSLLLRRRNVSTKAALKLLDDASAAIQYNRDLLQTALDEVGQGIAVFDRDLRLVTWNRRFESLIGLPSDLAQIGVSIEDMFRYLAGRGEFGVGDIDTLVRARLEAFLITGVTQRRQLAASGIILEVRTTPMPGGGYVTTFSDVTEQVRAAFAPVSSQAANFLLST